MSQVRNAAVVGGAWVLSRAGWLEPVAFVASAAFALWGLDSYVTGGVWAGRVTDLLLPGMYVFIYVCVCVCVCVCVLIPISKNVI
jgi:hypothetical protein